MAGTTENPVTPSFVRTIAPELSSSDSQIELFIELADEFVDVDCWGESKAKFGCAYMAAHLATLSERGGSGGPVTKETVDRLSVEYGAMGGSDNVLKNTAYGQVFLSIRNTVVKSPIVACPVTGIVDPRDLFPIGV